MGGPTKRLIGKICYQYCLYFLLSNSEFYIKAVISDEVYVKMFVFDVLKPFFELSSKNHAESLWNHSKSHI